MDIAKNDLLSTLYTDNLLSETSFDIKDLSKLFTQNHEEIKKTLL